jgi:hypothetical protein
MKNDPDQPIIPAPEHSPIWSNPCPVCLADAEDECTSLVSGCCIDGFHEDRAGAAFYRRPECT